MYKPSLCSKHQPLQRFRKLKEDVTYSEEEIDNLKRKNAQLQAAISSPGGNNPRDKVLQRLLQENPAPENLANQLDGSFVSSFVNVTVYVDWIASD